MAFNLILADRIRSYLSTKNLSKIEEKKMFKGLTFMIDEKMCVSVSNDKLMCRFDPQLHQDIAKKEGFEPMIMKGRIYKGYGYVNEVGYMTEKDFEYWLELCLSFNKSAKASKK